MGLGWTEHTNLCLPFLLSGDTQGTTQAASCGYGKIQLAEKLLWGFKKEFKKIILELAVQLDSEDFSYCFVLAPNSPAAMFQALP